MEFRGLCLAFTFHESVIEAPEEGHASSGKYKQVPVSAHGCRIFDIGIVTP